MQSVYLQRIMKKNADKGYEKTKPKQTQNKPNSLKAQMNVNSVLTRDYENQPLWTVPENKPNQTQSRNSSRAPMIAIVFDLFCICIRREVLELTSSK